MRTQIRWMALVLTSIGLFAWLISNSEIQMNDETYKETQRFEGNKTLTTGVKEETLKSSSPKAQKTLEKSNDEIELSTEQKRYLSGPKYLRKYLALNKYVLRSTEQNQKLWEELTSWERQSRALENLNDVKNESDSILERDRRLAIFYLSHAVAIKNNPHRQKLINQMAQYLLDSKGSDQMSEITKRSYAGDQIEVLQSLYRVSPELTRNLLREVEGTKKYALFKYALKDERQL